MFEAPAAGTGSVYFIGNATTLIQFGGFNLLTDPTFVHRHQEVSIGYGMHATRLTNPAVDIGELPPLDAVILSHFHGDHFDQAAEAGLNKDLLILTTPDASEELDVRGFTQALGIETWESTVLERGAARIEVVAVPARHGPPLVDFALPDVMGSVIVFTDLDSGAHSTMYISGDTLVFDGLHEIRGLFPQIDLALLHLGGTEVLGVTETMDAELGLEALRIVQPDLAIPIHYDDYDVFKSPLEDFKAAVRRAGLDERVRYLDRGESFTWQARGRRENGRPTCGLSLRP